MRLPDDDELYEVDQTYLGPPGRYIGVMRHKSIFAFLVVCPLIFVLARKLGIEMSFLTFCLLLVLSVYLSQTIADKVTTERSLFSLIGTAWHDLTAAREVSKGLNARAEDGFRRVRTPTGGVGRWASRRAQDATTKTEGEQR